MSVHVGDTFVLCTVPLDVFMLSSYTDVLSDDSLVYLWMDLVMSFYVIWLSIRLYVFTGSCLSIILLFYTYNDIRLCKQQVFISYKLKDLKIKNE